MRTYLLPVAALGLLASVSVASAEEATGVISTVDPAANAFQLDTGELFILGEGLSADALAPGTSVTVTYEIGANGEMLATDVQPSVQ